MVNVIYSDYYTNEIAWEKEEMKQQQWKKIKNKNVRGFSIMKQKD